MDRRDRPEAVKAVANYLKGYFQRGLEWNMSDSEAEHVARQIIALVQRWIAEAS